MQLERMLDRCRGLEERAAAVYRRFAAAARAEPQICALWTGLAREEEEHADSIGVARSGLALGGDSRVRLDGWADALSAVDDRLRVAEQLGPRSTMAEQLAAALDIEMTELEALRQAVLAATGARDGEHQADHAAKLAEVAETLTDDPQVRLQVALLRARMRTKHHR